MGNVDPPSGRTLGTEETADISNAGSSKTARDGVSREVPCSALKGETVPDSLPATPKSPPTRRVPPRGTPRVPARLDLGFCWLEDFWLQFPFPCL